LIRSSWYPVLKVEDKIIWDLTNFDKSDSNELLTSNVSLEPIKRDDLLTFCKGNFNVKSLIYEIATPEDILTAWIDVRDDLKLDRLIKLFLRDSMYNLYLTKNLYEEPDTVLALRLVYWYYRCKNLTNSFIHKGKEVRHKLTKGLLKQRERISRQLDADANENIKLNNLASDWEMTLLQNNVSKKELRDQADKYRQEFFKDIWNVTSELLFAGVCGDNGFDIAFVPASNQHDFDFIVNGYPAQIKSLNTPELVSSLAGSHQKRGEYVDSGGMVCADRRWRPWSYVSVS
jgi:hypothetical protein